MVKLHEMTFAQFAAAVRPSAGMNRWPYLGESKEMVSYSVYMNGPLVSQMPSRAVEHEFRDVAVHALSEKLGLNPVSFRDNIKVAELVALRHAYMTVILEASVGQELQPQIMREYELLTDQLTHPYIKQAIAEQKALSEQLKPVLAKVEKIVGRPVHEQPAAGVVRGPVISVDSQFMVQSVSNGEIVAHENARLNSLPAVGQDVTVSYYRGIGQVFENVQNIAFSKQYIDQQSGDLAINVLDSQRRVKEVVLFHSMLAVSQFAQAHGLDNSFVEKAIDLRTANPKKRPEIAERVAVGDAYLDDITGCIAIDYREGGAKYTAIFNSLDALQTHTKQAGIKQVQFEAARLSEMLRSNAGEAASANSLLEARQIARGRFDAIDEIGKGCSQRVAGKIVAETALHLIQDVGRAKCVIHDKRDLDKMPFVGERLTVVYDANGRGEVKMREVSKAREIGR